MTDISTLQQQWEQHLGQIMPGRDAAVQQNAAYAATLAALRDKIKQRHGLSRLKNIFTKVTKIAPLRHKQKKIAKLIAEKDRQLTAAAVDIVTTLGEGLVADSRYEGKYNDLQNAIEQTKKAKDLVSSAASTCRDILTSSRTPGPKGTCGSFDPDAATLQRYKDTMREVQQALASLNRQVGGNVPQVDDSVINWKNDGYKELNITNGLRTLYWIDDLAPVMQNLADKKLSVLTDVVTEAGRTSAPIDKLMKSLEHHMSPDAGTAMASAALRNTGPAI